MEINRCEGVLQTTRGLCAIGTYAREYHEYATFSRSILTDSTLTDRNQPVLGADSLCSSPTNKALLQGHEDDSWENSYTKDNAYQRGSQAHAVETHQSVGT